MLLLTELVHTYAQAHRQHTFLSAFLFFPLILSSSCVTASESSEEAPLAECIADDVVVVDGKGTLGTEMAVFMLVAV